MPLNLPEMQAWAAILASLAAFTAAATGLAARSPLAPWLAHKDDLIGRLHNAEETVALQKTQIAGAEFNARLAEWTREEAARLESLVTALNAKVDAQAATIAEQSAKIAAQDRAIGGSRSRISLLETWVQALEAALSANGIPLPAGRPAFAKDS